MYVYIYIYVYICMWRGPLCIEWRGLGKNPSKIYNNCPKVNFDFICRRSTFSHFHLASEDLNYNSIREASLKSDLHIHLLFNGSINSWLHFLWLSFKFAVLFILAFVDFLSEIEIPNEIVFFRFRLKFACKDQFPFNFFLKLFQMFVGIIPFGHGSKTAAPL